MVFNGVILQVVCLLEKSRVEIFNCFQSRFINFALGRMTRDQIKKTVNMSENPVFADFCSDSLQSCACQATEIYGAFQKCM